MIGPGSRVHLGTYVGNAYTVVRLGCATGWAECVHGDSAVTVQPDGKSFGWATCHHLNNLTEIQEDQ